MAYKLDKYLMSCGKRTFVDYIECFLKGYKNNNIRDKIHEEFCNSCNSANTKYSTCKKIYENGDVNIALKKIIDSRVEIRTKNEARRILDNINNNKYPCIP